MIPLNDLKRSYRLSVETRLAISRVLDSGHWVHGPEHELFETELADYLGVKHVLGVASGTDALEIALLALGCDSESRVITVANAGGYVSIAASRIGCEVLYCDIDPITLQMDPSHLKTIISEEIDVVVVTHLYGNVAPILEIKNLCNEFGIKVIEDCAQALGASTSNLKVGSICDIGTFSFYPTKNLGGVGDGGALACNSDVYADKIRSLRQYGWGEKYFVEVLGGMNSRLDEIQAAILRIGLPLLDEMNEKRRNILAIYSQSMRSTQIKLVTSFSPGNVGHLAVCILPSAGARENFRTHMRNYGIQTQIHYPILDSQQRGFGLGEMQKDIPISVQSVHQIVTIPLFPELESDEVEIITKALEAFQSETVTNV